MTKWQDWFNETPGRLIEGRDFAVRLYAQGGLRYFAEQRSITLLTEIVDGTDKLGKKWLIFPRVRVIVYLPSVLRWDDGAFLEKGAASIVMGRILEAFTAAGEVANVDESDEVYQQAEKDFERYGPQAPK